MNNSSLQDLEKIMNPEKAPKAKWAAFVETDVANFFNLHDLEKLAIEDGNGNKAKLTRQKDNSIKVEYSSVTII